MAAKRTRTPTTVRKKKSKVFCYTKDLTEALGVTRRTLYKYVQGRLLPAPILVSNGKTGVRARWTMTAMEHAEFIREQKDIGYTLGEITAAAGEQSSGIGQINSAVADLDRMTQQNAGLVQQSTGAARSLQEQAERLLAVLATFQTAGAQASTARSH